MCAHAGIEPKDSYMLSTGSKTEIYLQPQIKGCTIRITKSSYPYKEILKF